MSTNIIADPIIKNEKVVRFTLNERIQHWILLTCMIVLSLTGLALKFHDSWFGKIVIALEGGMEARGTIHRVFAVILMALVVYHVFYLLFSEKGHAQFIKGAPRLKDFQDFYGTLRYYLGITDETPKFGWFDFRQKFQYWGVAAGSVIMIFTGLVLWFETQSMAVMPKWIFDLTAIVHGYEGLILFLVLFLWHMYVVHLSPENFPMNRTWLSGEISLDKLKEHHALEYERLVKERPEERF